ncbi:metallophosphoesterase family protein [Variovorax ginsengisoli]|uniref:DNA repair exonuclease SbcCD nuclease subunit n=1 Tax=Variovorax ginsengisoli TaxID=363844 RepID=A0ABT9SES8_9BURK|nr:DNA repair exonuclease [Variovorax ginsengisoli]MDP9902720.1 DNA repair exonuclease SbcCD nuclease subunit [Variovorax ginsengisoli]
MPLFLHTADWQIGRQYSQFAPDDAVPIAEARIDAVSTLARLAAEQRVDAVLVAGDVFDAQTVADRTIRRLFNAMAGFAGPWILIPGNHDAALAESVWTRAQRLNAVPSHVHLSLQPQTLEFEAAGFAVLTAPLTQRHTYNDLTERFDRAETPAGLLRIGMAHGAVQGILAADIDSANPIAPERAERARLDYLALGDWHGCKQIDARTWYSGTPETDRFRANDPGFALRVQIDGPGALPEVTSLAVGRYRWSQAVHTLAVASDADALIARLATLDEADVVQIALDGQTDLQSLARIQAAASQAEARARSLAVDFGALRLLPTDADIQALNADGYLGDVIATLRDRQAGPEPQLATQALALLAALLADRRAAGAAPVSVGATA